MLDARIRISGSGYQCAARLSAGTRVSEFADGLHPVFLIIRYLEKTLTDTDFGHGPAQTLSVACTGDIEEQRLKKRRGNLTPRFNQLLSSCVFDWYLTTDLY